MTQKTESQLSIEAVPDLLDGPAKVAFFNYFWGVWAINGFGTLTKKDTELLIFGCLKKALSKKGPKTNFDWATLLRLTPARIKTIRLESHQRFGHLLSQDADVSANDFLENFTNVQTINISGFGTSGDLGEVTISFVVEDPVIQMIIENRLKKLGTYLDFHRNKEVIKIKFIDFLKIVASEVEEKAVDNWIKAKAKERAEADGLISRVVATEWAEKSESGKAMTFIDDLAEFANAKPLADRLKTIFSSQSERKK